MPHLQKLYDRVKDRKDIQIVTFSIDDNVAAIAPFMKENKYTFPVVPAHLLMHDLMPTITIPLNWFVDANGVVRFERVGFGDLGKWVDETLEQLEKLRKGATQGTRPRPTDTAPSGIELPQVTGWIREGI